MKRNQKEWSRDFSNFDLGKEIDWRMTHPGIDDETAISYGKTTPAIWNEYLEWEKINHPIKYFFEGIKFRIISSHEKKAGFKAFLKTASKERKQEIKKNRKAYESLADVLLSLPQEEVERMFSELEEELKERNLDKNNPNDSEEVGKLFQERFLKLCERYLVSDENKEQK